MPKVNPFLSVGIGTLVSIVLAVTGWAMQVDSVLRGHRRVVRAGVRGDDGRLSALGRQVGRTAGRVQSGRMDLLGRRGLRRRAQPGLRSLASPAADPDPLRPVAAFVVGLVLYYVLAKAGLQTKTLEMPQAAAEKA